MTQPEIFTPSEAAALLGNVDASTIRRWCEWHGEHLSPSANPPPGGQRQLTAQDVETLREVQRLRVSGLTTKAVNMHLAGRVFAVVDTPASPQEGQGEALAPINDESSIATLQSLATALLQSRNERERWHGFIIGLSVGLIVASVFFLIIVTLLQLFGGG